MPTRPLPGAVRTVFSSVVAERSAAFFAELYGSGVRDEWADGRPLRHTRTDLGEVTVDELENGATYRYELDPVGAVQIVTALNGRVERRTEGADGPLGFGEPTVLADPDRLYAGRTLTATSLEMVTLTVGQLAGAAGRPSGGDTGSLRFASFSPISDTASRHWRLAVDHVKAVADTTPEVYAEPLVRHSTTLLLASCALTAFPSSYLPTPRAGDRVDATPDLLRRAISYLETNAHLPVTVGDVALHCRVSVRTVQYAFRKGLDTTPMAHLRRIRLDGVHRDLVLADPSTGATVTAIAARWGFFNHGKFAEHYRTLYARLPSATLRA